MSHLKQIIDLGYPTEAHGHIPSFANVEEEAALWDTYDFTDFAEESSPVQIAIGSDLAERPRQERSGCRDRFPGHLIRQTNTRLLP